jgi:hypothetical protein
VQYEKLSTGTEVFSFVTPDQEGHSVSGRSWLFEYYQREMTYEQAQRLLSDKEVIDLSQPNVLVAKTSKLILLAIIPIFMLWVFGALTVWVISGFKKEKIPDITSLVFPAKNSSEPASIFASTPPVVLANDVGEKGVGVKTALLEKTPTKPEKVWSRTVILSFFGWLFLYALAASHYAYGPLLVTFPAQVLTMLAIYLGIFSVACLGGLIYKAFGKTMPWKRIVNSTLISSIVLGGLMIYGLQYATR